MSFLRNIHRLAAQKGKDGQYFDAGDLGIYLDSLNATSPNERAQGIFDVWCVLRDCTETHSVNAGERERNRPQNIKMARSGVEILCRMLGDPDRLIKETVVSKLIELGYDRDAENPKNNADPIAKKIRDFLMDIDESLISKICAVLDVEAAGDNYVAERLVQAEIIQTAPPSRKAAQEDTGPYPLNPFEHILLVFFKEHERNLRSDDPHKRLQGYKAVMDTLANIGKVKAWRSLTKKEIEPTRRLIHEGTRLLAAMLHDPVKTNRDQAAMDLIDIHYGPEPVNKEDPSIDKEEIDSEERILLIRCALDSPYDQSLIKVALSNAAADDHTSLAYHLLQDQLHPPADENAPRAEAG